jgi:hypothetical protein
MKIIVPCCGRSSRFPELPPKWTLPWHDGRPMVALAVSRLLLDPDDLVVTVLGEHEERFGVSRALKAVFGGAVTVVTLNQPTRSQPETVAQTLERLGIAEPFLVKDSDNIFHIDDVEQKYNYVCVDSLNNHDLINPRNKSYIAVDHEGLVTNIREKVVISDRFGVGGYYFSEPAQYLAYFHRLTDGAAGWDREVYLSDIIAAMILDGIPLRARQVSEYQDWGTIHDWRRAMLGTRTFFVLLDGFVLERGSEFFQPLFDEVQPLPAGVEIVRTLAQHGHKLIYLSVRPTDRRELTERQIAEAGLPPGDVVYGCPISRWELLTAPHATLPFSTCGAVELHADDPNAIERLIGLY